MLDKETCFLRPRTCETYCLWTAMVIHFHEGQEVRGNHLCPLDLARRPLGQAPLRENYGRNYTTAHTSDTTVYP